MSNTNSPPLSPTIVNSFMMAEMKFMIEKMSELQTDIALLKGGTSANSVRCVLPEQPVNTAARRNDPREPYDTPQLVSERMRKSKSIAQGSE